MKGIGTLVNVLAILLGGSLGVMIRGKWHVRIQRLILQLIGVVALFLGTRSLLDGWFTDSKTTLEVTGTLLVIFALVIGAVFGEAFRLDRLLDKLGRCLSRFDKSSALPPEKGAKGRGSTAARRKDAVRRAKKAVKRQALPEEADAPSSPESKPKWWQINKLPTHDLPDLRTGNRFADGFALSTVLCALSAMSFSGAIAEGLNGEPRELFIKAIIDGVIVLLLASIYGRGATFGAAPVLVVQGIMTFVSMQWGKLITTTLTAHFIIVAAVITIGAGINLCFDKRFRIVNLVPALLISPIYGLIVDLAEKFGDK